MDIDRHLPRGPRAWTRLGVGSAKVAVAGTFAVLAVSSAGSAGSAGGLGSGVGDPGGVAHTAVTHAERLIAAHDCTETGFGPDVVPGSAVVRQHGRVRLVGFDQGWAVYTGRRPGTLLAVCRGTLAG